MKGEKTLTNIVPILFFSLPKSKSLNLKNMVSQSLVNPNSFYSMSNDSNPSSQTCHHLSSFQIHHTHITNTNVSIIQQVLPLVGSTTLVSVTYIKDCPEDLEENPLLGPSS